MAKNERIYIRVSEEFKSKIQEMADKENRTVSNYIENILKREIETMKKLAMIREDDKENGKVIYFKMNSKTFEVTASNGEEVDYGNEAKNEKEAIKIIGDQWGDWKTFEWIEN